MLETLKNKIDLALANNRGKLISPIEDYKNAQTKLMWMCEFGHEFGTTWNKVQQGRWCPTCAGRNITMSDIKDLAKNKGGKCLSKTYVKCIDKLLWECALGHQWEASLNSIKNSDSWCPYCSKSVAEEICRKCFEFVFSKKFPRIRPPWLISELSGQRLELDGFCEELKLAFEYNGFHHYQVKDTWYHAKENLEMVQLHDLIKQETCNKMGITLIIIPDCNAKHSKIEHIKRFLIDTLPLYNYTIPTDFSNFQVVSEDLYGTDPMNELQQIAADRGGKCLSSSYQGVKVHLQWQCKYGHMWDATPNTIKHRNSWCPICADPNKMELNDLLIQLSSMKDNESDPLKKKILSKTIIILSKNV